MYRVINTSNRFRQRILNKIQRLLPEGHKKMLKDVTTSRELENSLRVKERIEDL
jgi:hypothetical protein